MTKGMSPFDWLDNAELSAEDTMKLNEAAMAAANEAQLEFAKLCFEVLETSPRGPVLMKMLDDMTIRLPLMRVTGSLVEGEVSLAPSDWAFVREGQNSIVRFLQNQIEFARNPPQQKEQGDE